MCFRAGTKLAAVAFVVLPMIVRSANSSSSATVSPVTMVTGSLLLSMSEADANTVTHSGLGAQKVKDVFADSLRQSIGENPPDLWISKDMIEIIAITKGSRRRLEQTLRQLSGGSASGKVKVDYSIRVPNGMTITAVAAKVVAMSQGLFMATASSKLLAAGIRSALCPTGPARCSLQALNITGMDVPLAPTVKVASTAPKVTDSDGLGAGTIAGILGGAVVLTIIIIFVMFMCKGKKGKKTKPLNQIVPCESDIPDTATPSGPSAEPCPESAATPTAPSGEPSPESTANPTGPSVEPSPESAATTTGPSVEPSPESAATPTGTSGEPSPESMANPTGPSVEPSPEIAATTTGASGEPSPESAATPTGPSGEPSPESAGE